MRGDLWDLCAVGSTVVLAGSRYRARSVMRLCGVCFVVVVMVLLPCMTWFCGRYLPMGAYPFGVFFTESDYLGVGERIGQDRYLRSVLRPFARRRGSLPGQRSCSFAHGAEH